MVNLGVDQLLIDNNKIRVSSFLYMIYWINRLQHNEEEQLNIIHLFNQYMDKSNIEFIKVKNSNHYDTLVKLSDYFVNYDILPVQTVDLVIERNLNNHKEVLLFDRPKFPFGISLPGGIVHDSDESNPLNADPKIYAALRIAADKVLYLNENERIYEKFINSKNELSFIVRDKLNSKKIIIHPQQIYGHSIKENIKSVIRPSDVRHLVQTTGFKCEIFDNSSKQEYFWESKSNLLSNNIQNVNKRFAFNHHKEIILHTLGKSSLDEELTFNDNNFIKSIINNPNDFYQSFYKNSSSNNFNPYISFPQLFPVVNKLLNELFTDDINQFCDDNKALLAFRDKTINSLRHVSLKNRNFCPYLPTLHAIFDTVKFFDVIERMKKDFYNDLSSNSILEHNPKEKQNAPYHMYKYEYRMHELLSKIPNEIIIPTFTNLSATDLLKVRGFPIRFVGLSKDFIYVDEFEQSPEEFLMHDLNHSYRMSEQDDIYISSMNLDIHSFIKKQQDFSNQYLKNIIISSNDDEKTKEIKKIKKIILFEICHEDAKPFLPDVILQSIIKKEGGETAFELPTVDPKTHYMDIVDVIDTEISTLSYVRNKLQCGFYDKVDKQNNFIVNPSYRKSNYIAEAALEMVTEISSMLNLNINISYDYLLKRTCSVGPDNIYNPVQDDVNVNKLNDGASFLNPKRYLV